jgi:hypothetical protein
MTSLQVHNHTRDPPNYTQELGDIQADLESSDTVGLNGLDIRNPFRSNIPSLVADVDALHMATRRAGETISKAEDAKAYWDSADHEFFLLSSQSCISTIHVDTAGQLTYIIGITGCKTWYLPQRTTTQAVEKLTVTGSLTPEGYGGWGKIDIRCGDLLYVLWRLKGTLLTRDRIMPPGCPHAVFTPETSLTFGGNFYTLPHLGNSLRMLALQAKLGFDFSNEPLTEGVYQNFLRLLAIPDDELNPEQRSSIAAGCLCWGITKKPTKKGFRALGKDFVQLQYELQVMIWDAQTRINATYGITT